MGRALFFLAIGAVLGACNGMRGFPDASGDAGLDAIGAAEHAAIPEAAPDTPVPGHPCASNAQCNDNIPCTNDLCGSDNRCLNLPNNSLCDDGVYCDGAEICDVHIGCTHGVPVTCDDGYTCTEDRCVEATRSCVHLPLDRDNDGDPDEHCQAPACGDAGVPEPDAGVTTPCWRGHDCNDLDPRINSFAHDICGSPIDFDCRGPPDANDPDCINPVHGMCSDALDISAGGVFTADLSATGDMYSLNCAGGLAHDFVAVIHLTASQDLLVRANAGSNAVALALQTQCGSTDPSSTLSCEYALPTTLRAHSLPPGDYYVLVGTTAPTTVELSVQLSAPTPAPTNDTCAMATVVPATGGTFQSDFVGLTNSLSTTCGGGIAPTALYVLTLTSPQNVQLEALSDDTQLLELTLTSDCMTMPDELRCDAGPSVQMSLYQLPAGTYYIVLQSFDPASYTLDVIVSAPTPPPPGDVCSDPLTLVSGTPVIVSASLMQDDYRLSCDPSGRDSVFDFNLTTRSDVMIDTVPTLGDAYFGVSIASTCPGTSVSQSVCNTGTDPRSFALGLDPGTYYVITKPDSLTDYAVTLTTFPPLGLTPATGNDQCSDAFPIPAGRGLFQGDTTTLSSNYSSPCSASDMAHNAVFRLHLDTRQRVTLVLDSSFLAAMWITETDDCPGTAPTTPEGQTCNFGTYTTLDNTLDAGDYYIFIVGFAAGAQGTYQLLVQQGS